METKRSPIIPILAVCIWGSLYIASGIVLKEIPALLLLFFRFFLSSVILIALGFRTFKRIRTEDIKHFLFIGFNGYFLANAALMLGIQFSTGSFSSLINSTSPVFVTMFAVLILGEQIRKKDILSLVLSILGAAIVIGSPEEAPAPFGVFCSVFSVVLWSYVTIHIKKLSEQYPPLEVTAVCMGIASVFSLPAAYAYYRISGETLHMTSSLILPILYICLICTALSHFLWNRSLRAYGAAYCASFYPLQPIVSMALGVLLLHEPMTAAFLIGLVLIVAAMVIHGK